MRVDGVGAADDPQAGGVREVRLVRLAVVLDRADAATDRDADDDGRFTVPSDRARILAACDTIWSNAG
ncbi:hypothetical protein GCM10025868_24330 [Angustibacter aerolatus]|uniref:Uncharacterized protein n=1 Tax=Angustibacter aerolatus TaxID=1162965 RepID=A0ABQ6JIG0_9ACTN|nr:hypothetical protein GCM10025868_24330 [Angustibacter aerolatus]